MRPAFFQPLDHEFRQTVAPAVIERVVLLLNHLLAGEPAAIDRLRPHAGRRLRLRAEPAPASGPGWPAWLPPLPELDVRVTRAGLLEAVLPVAGVDAAAPDRTDPGVDLDVALEWPSPASAVAGLAAGRRPSLQLVGDARLAADVNWLAENLRWDALADVERVFGPWAAQGLGQLGRAVGPLLQRALAALAARTNPPFDGSTVR